LKNAKNKNLTIKRILNAEIQANRGGPNFTFILPGGAARTPAPCQLRHCHWILLGVPSEVWHVYRKLVTPGIDLVN